MEKLSAKAKVIYNLLRNKPTAQDENGTYCTYPIKELASNSNISIMTVRRILKELEEKNYISCQKQGGNKEQKIYLNTPSLENEHSISENEHSIPENEHSTPKNEHSISENEHSISENEHSIPENVHSNFEPPVYYNNYQRNFMYSRFNEQELRKALRLLKPNHELLLQQLSKKFHVFPI